MGLIESIKNTSEDGVDASKKYLITSYRYTKLKIFYLLTKSAAFLAKFIFVGGLVFAGLLFMAIAGALVIGEYFNNDALGYLIIGIGLIILGLIFLIFSKTINRIIITKLSKLFK